MSRVSFRVSFRVSSRASSRASRRVSSRASRRVSSCVARALVLTLLAVAPASARAQPEDWLRLAPECGHGADARALGRMALLYPRVGLPAVVEVGGRLVTRVRVPSGLTPPPGVQQDRALVGWSAELVGGAIPADAGVRHHYRLRIVDVRPDGATSLVYRATVLVPRWAAPGTYGLRLSAPGGSDAVAAAVRVLPPERAPMLGQLGALEVAPAPAAQPAPPDAAPPPDPGAPLDPGVAVARTRALLAPLARLPVDVWIAADGPELRGALGGPIAPERPLPAVLLIGGGGPEVVLRAGPRALVPGRCDGTYLRFDEQLEGIAQREGLAPEALGPEGLPGASLLRIGDGPPRPLPPAPAPVVVAGGVARVDAFAEPTLLDLVVAADARAVVVEGASAELFPATPVDSVGSAPALVVRLTLPAGAQARVSRGPAEPLELALLAEPARAQTSQPVRLRARPSRPARLVAWHLGEDRSAVGDEVTTSFGALGPHRVEALAVDERGVTAWATVTVEAVARERGGCDGGCAVAPGPAAAAGSPGRGASRRPGPPPLLGFWHLALLVVGRALRRRGNSRRSPSR